MPRSVLNGTTSSETINVNDTGGKSHFPTLINGKGGDDTFHFQKHGGSGTDKVRIGDFNSGDKLDLSALGVSMDDITISRSGKITVDVDGGHDLVITLGQPVDLNDIIF